MNRIGNVIVKLDNICDYIPIVSTATNLVNLFQKTVVLPRLSAETVTSSHYYTHLKEKDTARCLILLVPVIGNIYVWIDDFLNNKQKILADLQKGEWTSFHCSSLKNNPEFILEAYRVASDKGMVLYDCPKTLLKDANFVLSLVKISPADAKFVFYFADKTLKSNPEFVLSLVKISPADALSFMRCADKTLWNDQEFMLNAIEQNATLIRFASFARDNKLYYNRAFVIEAMKRNLGVVEVLIKDYQGDKAEGDKIQDHWKALFEEVNNSPDFSDSVKNQFRDLVVGQTINT